MKYYLYRNINKRPLFRLIHQIYNMDHMRVLGFKPTPVTLALTKKCRNGTTLPNNVEKTINHTYFIDHFH